MSLGDIVTVHELEWQPPCVFQIDLVPVPYGTDPLLLFLTSKAGLGCGPLGHSLSFHPILCSNKR